MKSQGFARWTLDLVINCGFQGLKSVDLTMNRSFRAPEREMQAAVAKQRQQMRTSVMKEKEEELALFLEMRKREKERNSLLIQNSDEFDAPLGMKFLFFYKLCFVKFCLFFLRFSIIFHVSLLFFIACIWPVKSFFGFILVVTWK